MNLPTRPTKKTSRSRGFSDESCELDAIEPAVLRQMVEDAITSRIDAEEWEKLQMVEALEIESIPQILTEVSDLILESVSKEADPEIVSDYSLRGLI